MFQLLFPQLKRRKWAYLPLGTLAVQEVRLHPDGSVENPLLDAKYCQGWVRRIQRRYRATCSYGGWFEDRSILWKGHYMEHGQTFHLGVDFNVPPRTRTYSPVAGVVTEVWVDPDDNGGWGGRVMIKLKKGLHMILAHLGTIAVKVGDKVEEGSFIGTVGTPSVNGNWFPHLHVQMVRGSLRGIDGYGEFSPAMQRRFPDPMQYVPTYAGRLGVELPAVRHKAC